MILAVNFQDRQDSLFIEQESDFSQVTEYRRINQAENSESPAPSQMLSKQPRVAILSKEHGLAFKGLYCTSLQTLPLCSAVKTYSQLSRLYGGR